MSGVRAQSAAPSRAAVEVSQEDTSSKSRKAENLKLASPRKRPKKSTDGPRGGQAHAHGEHHDMATVRKGQPGTASLGGQDTHRESYSAAPDAAKDASMRSEQTPDSPSNGGGADGEVDTDATSKGNNFSSSQPMQRRLGKTHGRARKSMPDQVSGERGTSKGNALSRPPVLPSSTPGQGKRRKHTLSIAIPGSVVDNAQNRELKTYLVGEMARAATVFEVDEIVVYDDLSVSRRGQGGVRDDSATVSFASGGSGGAGNDRNNPNVFMARLLQYAETPQYLRKQLFPMHATLRLAGLLNPLDAPHHMRADDSCPYREGVVLDKTIKKGAGSFVDIGKRLEARIDRALEPGVRVTVKLDQSGNSRKSYRGKAVAPSTPREEAGLYWGYQTRLASGIADVIAGCPFKGGYDLTIGTSERGTTTVEAPCFSLPNYRHALVVFGGVQGIEATVDADETLPLPGNEASVLFDMWVNICPGQGSRTIRTEEAVLIALARLRPHVLRNSDPRPGE